MRISDWSSDVCSSDLHGAQRSTSFCTDCPWRWFPALCYHIPNASAISMLPAYYNAAKRGGRSPGTIRRSHSCCPYRYSQVRRRKARQGVRRVKRSEEHTSELQSLMRISYAVFCLKKKRVMIV